MIELVRQFTIYLSLVCFISFSQAADSFYDLTPKPQQIDGKHFPRNNLTLYRGTTDHQMDLTRALRALLGDSSAYVESLFFSTIKNRLMKTHFPAGISIGSFLDSEIENLLAQNGRALTEAEAVAETKRLVDGTFRHLDSKNSLIDRYVNYQSGQFIDWPQDVVFTSVISPVAGTYGDRMLVVQEKTPRSLDLNFWNKVNHNVWFHYTRDAGEFIAFGYLNPQDLLGYQLRSGYAKSWHFIETAFYKVTNHKTQAVLVFSGERSPGRKSTCIDFNSQDKTYYHCDYRTGSVVMEPPPISQDKPQLIGVIVLCSTSDKSKCDPLPDSEMKKYPFANSTTSSVLHNLNLKVNNKIARFFPAER